MDISENIKRLRVAHGYTQRDLADILQVKPTAVSAWELGRNKPLMDKITIMATLFSVSTSEIVGDTFETSDILPVYNKLDTKHKQIVYDFAKEQLADQQHAAEDQGSTYAIDDPALVSEQDNFKSTSD